ncbi:LPS assembly lipoprotein LptE [Neptunicoccus sediminis]|uniref:LPS assembly lipoprotein LptE n=1 Tax=Neptunicoccus sediminis TaxID=1892596 RepID=UPI000845BD6C|nr:LPS assembly lipoprotein LptE [Neptunicoccus sediminis]
MLLFNRRIFLALALSGGVAACGFEPVYQQGKTAANLRGQIAIDLVKGRNGFELRQQLEDRLGHAGDSAPYVLSFSLALSESALAVTADEGTTRTNLTGIATFAVRDSATRQVVFEDSVKNVTSYGSTSATYPSSVAKRDANTRLAKALANQIAQRIAITSNGWAG